MWKNIPKWQLKKQIPSDELSALQMLDSTEVAKHTKYLQGGLSYVFNSVNSVPDSLGESVLFERDPSFNSYQKSDLIFTLYPYRSPSLETK